MYCSSNKRGHLKSEGGKKVITSYSHVHPCFKEVNSHSPDQQNNKNSNSINNVYF